MTIKHRISCFDSEIIVKQIDEDGQAFQLSIQSGTNPLGLGNKLASYSNEAEAIRKSSQFCSFYTIAKEQGYYLKEQAFVKPEHEDIPVSTILSEDKDEQQLKQLIHS